MTAAVGPTAGSRFRHQPLRFWQKEVEMKPATGQTQPTIFLVTRSQAKLLRGQWPDSGRFLPFNREQAEILHKPHSTLNLHLT